MLLLIQVPNISCIRSDVTECLYVRGEECTILSCSPKCPLADGRKAQVKEAVRLHVHLLSFLWDHEFKVFNESSFPAILGTGLPSSHADKGGFVFQDI